MSEQYFIDQEDVGNIGMPLFLPPRGPFYNSEEEAEARATEMTLADGHVVFNVWKVSDFVNKESRNE